MGRYNHDEHQQVMMRKDVKVELEDLGDDIYKTYKVPRRKDVTYSKVIKCLMLTPAENIRSRASGVQEIVTSIIFNGSGVTGQAIVGASVLEHAR